MSVKIKLRRDTSSTWDAKNPTLAVGEPGFETDTGKLKIGNGTDPWMDLPYLSGEGGGPIVMEDIDDRVADLLEAGSHISLTYNDNQNSLTIAANIFPTGTIDLHNGGIQNAQVFQFDNVNYQSVITGPTPASGNNAQRIIVQGQRGQGSGEGGDVYLWGGDSDINGGDIKIYAGDADNGATGQGGYVNIDAGNGYDQGGNLTLSAGNSSQNGGNITITAGYSPVTNGTVYIATGGNQKQWHFNDAGALVFPNSTSVAVGTFDNSTGGNNGISLNCYVGYELNWQGGHLKSTYDNGATAANIWCDSAIEFPGIGADNVQIDSSGITFSDGTQQNSAFVDILSGQFVNVTENSGTYKIDSTGEANVIKTVVFNKTGTQIPKLSAVYINGGQGDKPTITLASASSEMTSSKTYGITEQNIDHMSSGTVVVFGSLTGVNTDQFNPTAPVGDVNGSTVWLSPTVSGGLTLSKPSAPNHMVSLGTIVRTHQNEGIIDIRIQNGFELEELHNVAISGVSNNQYLQYNSSSNLWIPTSSGNFREVSYTVAQVSFSTNQNDLALPSGAFIRLNPSTSSLSITGMAAGSDGQLKMMFNAGANAVTLAHYSASSAIQNRFVVYNGSNYTLQANNAVTMMYDGASAVWRIF